jgi:hypothetical protein
MDRAEIEERNRWSNSANQTLFHTPK